MKSLKFNRFICLLALAMISFSFASCTSDSQEDEMYDAIYSDDKALHADDDAIGNQMRPR